jgi:Uma2 family endonuclease
LRQGQRLTQKEFHRRYTAYPEDVKAELIGGVVHMPSPLGKLHGDSHGIVVGLGWTYSVATPGVRVSDNATTILGEESEPQPDVSLRILAEYGGQERPSERFIEGAPEWIAEVADSSEDIDLGAKRIDYEQAGVREYLVVYLAEQVIHWFDSRAGGELRPTRQGIYRSGIFPGLWIDGPALLAGNGTRLLEVVQQGIASRAHGAFVNRLARAHQRLSGQDGAG